MACSAKLKMSSVKIHLTPHRKRGGSKKIKRQKKTKKQWELQRSQLPDQSAMVLPACSVRTVLCTEDDSVLAWWAFFVGNIPLEKDSVFLFLFLYLLIAKLMYCHIRLMGLVAYQSPPSVCEHFNSNMENCMSKYQRVMPEVVAFFAEGGYSFWAHICQKHFLAVIRSHSTTIYSTSSSPKAFIPPIPLPLFSFSTPALLPTNTNARLYLYGLKALQLRVWLIDYLC